MPKDLRLSLKRAEYKFSLETSEKLKAQRKAGAITAIIWSMFDALRKGDAKVEKLSLDRIRELVSVWVKEELIQDEIDRATKEAIKSSIDIDDQFKDEEDTLFLLEGDCKENLYKADYSSSEETAIEILKKNSISVNKGSEDFNTLCREILKGTVAILQEEQKRMH